MVWQLLLLHHSMTEGEGTAREDGREEAEEATDILITSFHSE